MSDHHYLVGFYITHRSDGVHVEARCECGVNLECVGMDESVVLGELRDRFDGRGGKKR